MEASASLPSTQTAGATLALADAWEADALAAIDACDDPDVAEELLARIKLADQAIRLAKAKGDEAEALIGKLRSAVLNGTWEVKNDAGVRKHRNFYFEVASQNANGWEASGVNTTKASMWVHVFDYGFIGIPTWALRNIVRDIGEPRACHDSANPTKGRVVKSDLLIPAYLDALDRADSGEREAA
jgi:hypothetical protein